MGSSIFVIFICLAAASILFMFSLAYAVAGRNVWQKMMSLALVCLTIVGSIFLVLDGLARSPSYLLPTTIFLSVLAVAFYWSYRLNINKNL